MSATLLGPDFGKSLSASADKEHLIFEADDDFEHGIKASSVAEAKLAIRLGFLRKVFSILTLQLLATTFVGALLILTPGVKGFIQQCSWMVFIGFILSIVLLIAMMVKRHETPTNFILLFLWNACQSYTVGVIASFYDQGIVIEAFLLTTVVVGALLMYTLQTKRDFSAMGSSLFAVLCILLIGGILQMILMNSVLEFILALGGAILFSLFIIFDVQMIMNHMSPEEYILATITLYLDIINLFLSILRILGASNRE